MKFAYCILNNFTEIVSCPLLSMATMKMDCILKHLASIFKVPAPNFKAKPKMYNGLLFLKKKLISLSLISRKCVRFDWRLEKEISVLFGWKTAKCHDRTLTTELLKSVARSLYFYRDSLAQTVNSTWERITLDLKMIIQMRQIYASPRYPITILLHN